MKKNLFWVFILMIFAFASCDSSNSGNNGTNPGDKPGTQKPDDPVKPDKPTICDHDYKEFIVESTCEEYGYIKYVCSMCSDEYVGKEFDYLKEHEFSDWDTSDGGCEDDIISTRYCINCSYTEEEVKPGTSHKYNAVDYKEPDCTNPGYANYQCEYCPQTYFEHLPAPGHSYGSWNIITPATCKDDGLKQRECHCGDIEEEVILKGEHNYENGECTACGAISYLTFRLNSETNTYYVSKFDNSVSVVNIPSNINGILVTGIDDNTFENSYNVTKVVMPDTINYVGSNAFRGCTSLAEVKLSEGLTSISDGLFYECTSLTSIELPSQLKSIGMNAFFFSGLTSIHVPEGVTFIDYYAFSYCNNLTVAYLPSTIETLGKYIFDSSASIEKLTIPFIGSSINDDSNNLGYFFSDYEFNGSVSVKKGNSAFDKYYIPQALNEVVVLGGTIGTNTFSNISTIDYVALNNVTDIKSNAFGNFTSLKEITINSDSLANIGYRAFMNCSNLEKVLFEGSVQAIGESAFENCSKLISVSFASVKTIGTRAFANCTSLEDVYLPDDIENLNEGIFLECKKLKNLVIPFIGKTQEYNSEFFFYQYFGSSSFMLDNYLTLTITNDENIVNTYFQNFPRISKIIISDKTKTIGYGAFRYLEDLEEVILPDTITSIEDDAFSNNPKLTTINIPKSLKVIPNNMFYNCVSLSEIEIPEGVTSISGFAYTNISKINIPNTVTEIGNEAFSYTKLKEISLPEGLRSIGYSAFSGTQIEALVIPDSVENISQSILRNCINLNSLTIPFIGENVNDLDNARLSYLFEFSLYQTPLNKLKITKGTRLEEASETIKEIEVNENFVFGYNTFQYPLDKLTIGFNNVSNSSITNYANKINEIYVIGNVIPYNVFSNVDCDKIIVSETVKKVEANAFTSSTVSEIIFLGDDVELKDNSFYYTPQLKKLTIPNLGNSTLNQILGFGVYLDELILTNITSIPEYAFQDSDIKVTIKGDSLKEIQSYAFKDYLGEAITIPSSVTKINNNAFENTAANILWDNPTIEVLTQNAFNGYLGLEVVVPNSVKKLENSAFEGYRGSIDFSQVEELVIGDEAFYRYYGENITIPSVVKEIGDGAFSDYKGSITWDNPTIEVIKTGAFRGYLGTELVIPDSVNKIEEIALSNNSNLLKLTIPFVGTSLDAESNYRFDYVYDNENVVLDELNITQGTILRKGALENVDALAINLPNSLNTIKEDAFKYSTVQKIIVPNSVTTLEANAFNGCRNIVELGLPFLGTSEEGSLFIDLFGDDYSEVVYQYKDGKYVYGMKPQYLEILHINGTRINDYALFGFTTIKEINIASSVDYIGLGAFLYCDNLTNVNYHGTIDEWANIEMVSSPMEFASTFKCLDENNDLHEPKDVIINNKAIKARTMSYMNFDSITVGENVESIGSYAFRGYSGIVGFDTLKITKFDNYAFAYYEGESITIPSSVVEGSYHLFECYSGEILWDNPQIEVILENMYFAYYGTKLEIPESVKTIKKNAITSCDNLLSITIPSSITTIEDNFITINKLNEVHNLSSVNISLNNVVIHNNTEDSIISIVGDYAFAYKNEEYYLIGYLGEESSITLPNDINGNTYIISAQAFYNNEKLYSVNLGNGVKEIEMLAFNGCTRLAQIINPNSIKLPQILKLVNEVNSVEDDGLLYADDFVFVQDKSGYHYLIDYVGVNESIVLPQSINDKEEYDIHNYAFYENKHLYNVSIPNAVKRIGNYAFANCTYLKNVSFYGGEDIKEIGSYAFFNCQMLLSFGKLNKVEKIGNHAFYYVAIEYLDIQGTYTEISSNTFAYSNIDKLVLSPVVSILDSTFKNASVNLYFVGTKEQYEAIDIKDNNNIKNVYYYSLEEPSMDGCWYYDGAMNPTLWS